MTTLDDSPVRDIKTEMVEEKADEIVEKGYIPTIIEKMTDALAPSGNPHDYVSLTRYQMSRTDDGITFKDGEYNQSQEKYTDSKKMAEARTNLFFTSQAALVAQYDGQRDKANKYAKYSQDVLQTWFIDEKTKMTPNLEFAQMIEGENTGNFFGIIEGDDLLSFIHEAQRLKDTKLLDEKVLTGVSKWFDEYLDWLVTSEKGSKEKEMENNHGTFYDVQVATIADFVGKKDLVTETLERAKTRIDKQITSTGEMPLESQREDSYGYQLYNLYGYSKLASIGEKYNIDLWNYQAPNGGSLKKAFEHFSTELPASNYHPIPEERVGQFYLTLRAAARAYKEPKYFYIPRTYFPDSKLIDDITKITPNFREISETEINVMEDIRNKIKDLTDTHADRFGIKAYENGTSETTISTKTILVSEKGTYTVSIDMNKNKEDDMLTQYLDISNIQGETLYRLDVRSGDKITKEYKEEIEDIERLRLSFPDPARLLSQIALKSYRKDAGNEMSHYSSDSRETRISDNEALEILSNYKDLQFPPDMQNSPSLEKLRQQGLKFALES